MQLPQRLVLTGANVSPQFLQGTCGDVNGAIVNSFLATAWALLAGLFLYVGFNADDPGAPMLLLLLLLGSGSFSLLVVVMRNLLQQATTLRTDMEAVI